MKAFLSVTGRFFAQIWSDAMLIVLLFVPLAMGFLFRFGVPVLEAYLCERLARAALLAEFYPVFDLLLSVMTPVMFTAAGAMVILDEADLGLARAIAVTPVGRGGYLASRIGVPALLATAYCALVTLIFRLSNINTAVLLLLVLCSGALGVVAALLISTLAKNKVEGLAYSKLSGLLVLGLPAALLVPSPVKYLAGILPSLWMTELVMGGSALNAIPALLVSGAWVLLLSRHFMRRILG